MLESEGLYKLNQCLWRNQRRYHIFCEVVQNG